VGCDMVCKESEARHQKQLILTKKRRKKGIESVGKSVGGKGTGEGTVDKEGSIFVTYHWNDGESGNQCLVLCGRDKDKWQGKNNSGEQKGPKRTPDGQCGLN